MAFMQGKLAQGTFYGDRASGAMAWNKGVLAQRAQAQQGQGGQGIGVDCRISLARFKLPREKQT